MGDLERGYAERRKLVYYKHVHTALKKVTTAYATVLSILVTVSFIGFLQPPRGFDSSQGSRLYSSVWMSLFIITNSLSFVASICGLVLFVRTSFSSLQFYCALNEHLPERDSEVPQGYITPNAAGVRELLKDTYFFFYGINACLALAVSSCVAAYVFAGIAATRPSTSAHRIVLVIAGVSVVLYSGCVYVCWRKFPAFVDASDVHGDLWSDWRTESFASWLRFREVHKWQEKTFLKASDRSGSGSGRSFDFQPNSDRPVIADDHSQGSAQTVYDNFPVQTFSLDN